MADKINSQKKPGFSSLGDYQQNVLPRIEVFLDEFFAGEIKKAKKISPLVEQSLRFYRRYMHDGKKMRGILTCLGHEAAGGKNLRKVAGPAAAAIEIFHHFLLIHDDWIDRDEIRHGRATVHRQYEEYFEKKKWQGDGEHWAAGMAVVLGDIGCFLANKIVAGLSCNSSYKTQAMGYLSDYLVMTAYGEFMDITQDFEEKVAYTELLKARELKTAYYTLVMPLTVGAVLAGGEMKRLKAIKNYGLPVGIAFQLRDDELGVFGDDEKMGKSACQDLVSGKKTLLLARAVGGMTAGQRKKYDDFCRQGEIEAARKMVRESGALEYSQKMMKRLVKKGRESISGITKEPKLQAVLEDLAEFVIVRER